MRYGARIALVTAVLAIVAAAPAAAASDSCRPSAREHVVVRSHAAVVTSDGATWRGCLSSTGKHRRLFKATGDPYGRVDASDFVLAGHFVAFAKTGTDHYNAQSIGAQSIDLRSGRERASGVVGFSFGDLGGDTLVLERLVLSPRGWIAWRSRHEAPKPGTGATEQRVELADGRGQRLLDSGAVGSLGGPAFTRPWRVEWAKDGVSHTARAAAR
jgi:hypothetical protein